MTATPRSRAALVAGLCLAAACRLSAADLEQQERLAAEAKQEQVRQLMQQRDLPLPIRGTVLDAAGAPVEGAEVTVHIQHYSPDPENLFTATKTLVVRSNRDGSFEVTGERGREAYIHSVTRQGFENLQVGDLPQIFRPTPEGAPAAPPAGPSLQLTPRAKGQPLLKGSARIDLAANAAESETALFAMTEEELDTLGRAAVDAWPGLRASATQEGPPAVWNVALRGRAEADLVQQVPAPPAEAPLEGYAAQVSLTVPAGPPYPSVEAYLILKSSAPEVYSLLHLTVRAAPDRCTLHVESLTNPYGERLLKDAPEDAPRFRERRETERAARSALARGQKAPRQAE